MFQTDRIATGLSLRKVLPGVIYKSGLTAKAHAVPAEVLEECRQLGATLAAGIAAGIF
jgi:hypothetical protein